MYYTRSTADSATITSILNNNNNNMQCINKNVSLSDTISLLQNRLVPRTVPDNDVDRRGRHHDDNHGCQGQPLLLSAALVRCSTAVEGIRIRRMSSFGFKVSICAQPVTSFSLSAQYVGNIALSLSTIRSDFKFY